MSNTDGQHGPALVAYLDTLVGDASRRAWARERGLDDQLWQKWQKGSEPSVAAMRRIAEALGVSLGTILVAARYADEEEVSRTDTLPVEPCTLEKAIENDPALTDDERDLLRSIHGTIVLARKGRGSRGRTHRL